MARQKFGCKGGRGRGAKSTATGDPTPAPPALPDLATTARDGEVFDKCENSSKILCCKSDDDEEAFLEGAHSVIMADR